VVNRVNARMSPGSMYCNPSANGLLEAAHDALSGSPKGQRERLQALGQTKDPRKVPLL
jgi:hypothetical protein